MTFEQLRTHQGLLTVPDVAAALGLAEETVRRAVRRGQLRASKPAGRLRIEPEAVLAWLRETSTGPPAAAAAASTGPVGRGNGRRAAGDVRSFRARVRGQTAQ